MVSAAAADFQWISEPFVKRIDILPFDLFFPLIIKKVADDHQIRIPDEVVEFVLATTSREVGALIASFHQLYRYSMAEKRRITLPLAREVRELAQSEAL